MYGNCTAFLDNTLVAMAGGTQGLNQPWAFAWNEQLRMWAGVAPMLQYSIDDSVRNDAFEALLRGALAVATERERLRDRHARREDVVALNNLL